MLPDTLDAVDRMLLGEIQWHLPLSHRPFHVIGEKLGLSEQQCLERINRLRAAQFIRRLSGIIDAPTLGYQITRLAMQVDAAQVEEAVRVIRQHPGVFHLESCNDAFNVWVGIALPPSEAFEQVVKMLQTLAKADEIIALPALRVYKRGSKRDPIDYGGVFDNPLEMDELLPQAAVRPPLRELDIRLFRVVQEELPLIEIPYAVWAEQAELTEDELFVWLKKAQHLGYLRRIAAIPTRHHEAYPQSTMLVWQVPQEQVDVVGEQMALFREVSHCSRRPIVPRWPYALFTLIRAESSAACVSVVKRIEERIGQFPHKHLFTTKEHQRTAVAFFSPQLERWWEEIGSKVSY